MPRVEGLYTTQAIIDELFAGEAFPLGSLPDALPEPLRIKYDALLKMARKGRVARKGQPRVLLECALYAGKIHSSVAALKRFYVRVAQLESAPAPEKKKPNRPSPLGQKTPRELGVI